MRYLAILALIFVFAGNASAGERRGLITTTNCPYTCFDAGLSKDNCRERKIGNKCEIEDLTQPPGHRSMVRLPKEEKTKSRAQMNEAASVAADPSRRGLITSSNCPFTCKDLGVPKSHCREKQMGGACQVEDLRQAPGHRSLVRIPKEKVN